VGEYIGNSIAVSLPGSFNSACFSVINDSCEFLDVVESSSIWTLKLAKKDKIQAKIEF
jgi:hypothetical protein